MITLFDQTKVLELYEYNLKKEAREEGRLTALQDSLQNLMKNTGWPVEKALTVLNVPEAEWPSYRERLYRQ